MKPKLLFAGILLFIFLALTFKSASAQEGSIDLVGDNKQECLAFSVEVSPGKWSILTRCANLIYPPPVANSNYYVVWAVNTEGDEQRLGNLNLGKADFTATDPFVSLMVTIESGKNPLNPSGDVVMRGDVKPYVFAGEPVEEVERPNGTARPTATPVGEEAQQTSVLARITSFLLRAGIIILILVAIGAAIYYIVSKFR